MVNQTEETQPLPEGGPTGRIPFESGRMFGGYRLVRLLGTGGFADVWEAERLIDARRLALKVLRPFPQMTAEVGSRFEREGHLAAKLSHPRVVYVFAAEVIEGSPVIAMELMRGGSLQSVLDQDGALEVSRAVDFVLDLIEGLEAAERLGIVHRDVKPSNCFLDEAGRARVGDFGISKSLHIESSATTQGAFIGTPAFASPEQVAGLPVDSRSDLYSVGATLYALLSGRPPYDGYEGGRLLAAILTEPPRPLRRREISVPRSLDSVVLRLLAKDPARRYSSYGQLRAALLPHSSRAFAPASQPRRVAAFLLDQALLVPLFLLFGLLSIPGGEALPGIWRQAGDTGRQAWLTLALEVTYFTLCEWLWQRTPGKAIFGLRVGTTRGGRIALPQAIARNFTFCAFWDVPASLAALVPNGPWGMLLATFLPLGVCATMRRANAMAGAHEIWTGTRVMATHRRIGRAWRSALVQTRAGLPEVTNRQSGPIEVRGPYEITSSAWESGGAKLLRANDPALKRSVWILERPEGDSGGIEGGDTGRSTRLRWLQSGVHEGARWDALEEPSGTCLAELVRTNGRLGWAQVRRLLLTLASEIRKGLEEGSLPQSLSVANLWVDEFGELKVLEFPGAGAPTSPDLHLRTEWPAILLQVAVLALEGRAIDPMPRSGRPPRIPLPGRARTLFRALAAQETAPLDLDRVIAELEYLNARPAAVTPVVRGAHLACAHALVAIMAVGAVAGLLQSLPVQGGGVDLVGSASALHIFLLPFGLATVPNIVLAFAFRGGPVLRLMGLEVQCKDGMRAGRTRCALRALFAALPALLNAGYLWLGLALLLVHGRPATVDPDASLLRVILWHAQTALAGMGGSGLITSSAPWLGAIFAPLFAAGIAATVIRPERGIQDRLTGTHIMPA